MEWAWGRLWSEFARRSASRRRVKDEGRGGGRRSPEKLGAQSEDGEWAEGRGSLRFPSPVLALAPGNLGWAVSPRTGQSRSRPASLEASESRQY